MKPRRPAAPAWLPMLSFALSLWVAAACTLQASQGAAGWQCLAAASVSGAVGAACAVRLFRAGRAVAHVAVLGCCIGVLAGSAAAAGLQAETQAADAGGIRAVAFTALEDSREGDYGPSCTGRALLEDGSTVKVRVNLPEGAEVRCWQRSAVSCAVKPPSRASAGYYRQKGCAGSISPSSVAPQNPRGALGGICALRDKGIAACAEARARNPEGPAGDDAYALLQAVLFGYRAPLFASGFYDDVKTAGLAHIVAVSGAHLVIVTGFFSALLKAARVPKRICVPLQLAFAVSYAAFAGMPVSALRAAAMTCCALSAFYAGKRSSSVTALSACITVMLCLDPFLALSVSLALSSSASLGIVLLARYLSGWFDALFAGRAAPVSQSLGATLAANALTLPVSCAVFSQLPLIGPASNLLATPLFTATVYSGIAATAASCLLPGRAGLLFIAPALLAQLTVETVRLLAGVPFACVPVDAGLAAGVAASAGAVFLLLRFRPAPSAPGAFCAISVAACATAVVLFALPGAHGTEVVMLDVGQGDAVVYRSSGHAVLVDTGTDDAAVLAGLARHDVRKLDAVIVTHPDDDHCGSLQAVLDTVPVGRVCVARPALDCSCAKCGNLVRTASQARIEALQVGDAVNCGAFSLAVLGPAAFEDEGGNADSIVLSVSVDCDHDGQVDWTAFASGDAEAEALAPLLQRGCIGHADILKVPHHGSAAGMDERLLEALSPEIALVSVGEGNRYGHPTPEALGLLQDAGARVYRTDRCGDVVCTLTPSSLRVTANG